MLTGNLRILIRFFDLFIRHEPLLLLGPGLALELAPLDPCTQHGVTSHEQLVIVGVAFRPFRDSLEVIQIQLPLKAAKVAHLKILGHDVLGELLGLVDTKGPTMR